MESILTKQRFCQLWIEGLLGNRPRIWKTLAAVQASKLSDLIAIRYVGYGWAGPFITNLRPGQLSREMNRLARAGWRPSDFLFVEQITPGHVNYVINGEVIRTESGLCLYFSTENMFMRPALQKSGEHVNGIIAVTILRHLLWPVDFKELSELVDRYPEHAIEFSGFDRQASGDNSREKNDRLGSPRVLKSIFVLHKDRVRSFAVGLLFLEQFIISGRKVALFERRFF